LIPCREKDFVLIEFVVIYISVNQEGVRFVVNIFHHNLESIKAMSLRILNLICKILTQVFIYNSVAGGIKGKDLENVLAFRLFYLACQDILGPLTSQFLQHSKKTPGLSCRSSTRSRVFNREYDKVSGPGFPSGLVHV
jgi:hypothetical protein